jgi:four helix bundle protein
MLPVENLKVFQKAYKASLEVHKITLKYPAYEQYKGLASQLRDCSKSVVFNLTEGYSFKVRRPKRYVNHLEISIGSCDETRLGLKYSADLDYIEERQYMGLQSEYEEIGKMLWGLLNSVEKES